MSSAPAAYPSVQEVEMGTIVVGVDGSEGAVAALRFAVSEAGFRNMPLRVISAWEVPATAVGGGLVPGIALGNYRERAEEVVEAALAEAVRLAPDVECSGEAVHGPPASALVRAAGRDDLLVVGTRGPGGVASLLLGSVGREVLHDARCPVAVVPLSESG